MYREQGPVRRQRVNDAIRLSPIRLIDQNNAQIGVIETSEAMRMAREAGLDLVEIQADARPPICKIMDYGRYKFELSKKERGQRAASKQAEMKEVRFGRSQKIDDHDVEIRMNQARRFLMDGHKVQLVQRFRGREIVYKNIAFDRFKKIVDQLSDISKVEVPPRQFGPRMTMILSPDRQRIKSIKDREIQQKLQKQRAAEKNEKTPTPPEPPVPEDTAPSGQPQQNSQPQPSQEKHVLTQANTDSD